MLGLFKKKLPDCNELFMKYFSPWFPENHKPRVIRPDTYSLATHLRLPLDLEKTDKSGKLLSKAKNDIQIMTSAAKRDYQTLVNSEELNLKTLDAVDKFYSSEKIAYIIKQSDPSDYSNMYLISVCEFGCTLGYLFTQKKGYKWLYSFPYFDSLVLHKKTRLGISVFDWAVKKFSDYGVNDGYAAKFHAALDFVDRQQ